MIIRAGATNAVKSLEPGMTISSSWSGKAGRQRQEPFAGDLPRSGSDVRQYIEEPARAARPTRFRGPGTSRPPGPPDFAGPGRRGRPEAPADGMRLTIAPTR